MIYGLLGEHLSHSYSVPIHNMLGNDSYALFEVAPENLKDFFRDNTDIGGLNVTIPYKKDVLPFCDYIAPEVQEIGAANTIIRKDGRLCAYNTDKFGFMYMVKSKSISFEGKKVLILGSGGASRACRAGAKDLGAREIIVVSRTGKNNYQNIDYSADIVVNTTPLGMYPNNFGSAIDLSKFQKLEGVFDLIYNPRRTALTMQADELGIPNTTGLPMLVAQAKMSEEIFKGQTIADEVIDQITRNLEIQQSNIILIGMPGCGKSQIGHALAEITGKECIDMDKKIEEESGLTIPEIFEKYDEGHFRNLEHKLILEYAKLSGKILSLGGGAVIRADNYKPLHQNGTIFFIERAIDLLQTDGRPLSKNLPQLYENRRKSYDKFKDVTVVNDGSIEDAASKILELEQLY